MGGGEASNYRVSLGFQNREGVIQNEHETVYGQYEYVAEDA